MGDLADSVGLGPYFQKVRFLSDLGIMFWGLGYTTDRLIENGKLYQLLMSFTARFDSYSMVEVEMNIFKDWDVVAILLMTLPGKSCESIGTRIGIATRKVMGISVEGLISSLNIKNEIIDHIHDTYYNREDDDE